MIKVVFFDFDGVLSLNSNGGEHTCENMERVTGIPSDKLFPCYYKVGKDLVLGRKNHSEVWEEFLECVDQDIDIGMMKECLSDVPINNEMISVVKELRRKGYRTGIITDNSKERFDIIKEKFGLKELFDTITVSADVGCFKNDERIFKTALQEAEILASESVFIENSPKNLEIPKKMGFQTIFHDDKTNDIELLKINLKKAGVNF